jgi:hypothetical protein
MGSLHLPKLGSRAGLKIGITVHAVDRKESWLIGSDVLISKTMFKGGAKDVIV